MEWHYVWWPRLTPERVARVCEHQLNLLLTVWTVFDDADNWTSYRAGINRRRVEVDSQQMQPAREVSEIR